MYQETGNCYFFTKAGDSVLVKSKAAQGEEWTVFNYANGQKIKGKVDTIVLDSVMGILDSVKTVAFRLVDLNDAPFASVWNGRTIKLGQNFGLISGFDFYLFPSDTTRYYIVGCQNPVLGVHLPRLGEIYNLSVGDEFQFENFNTSETFSFPNHILESSQSSHIYSSQKVIQVNTTADLVYTTFARHSAIYQPSFQLSNDTIIRIDSIHQLYISGFPNEFQFQPVIAESQPTFGGVFYQYEVDTSFCEYGVVVKYNTVDNMDFWYEEIDSSCLNRYQFFEYIYTDEIRMGLDFGFLFSSSFSDNGGLFENHSSNNWLYYFKKGNQECGTPISESILLGIEKRNTNELSIYPNPTTGIIHFQNLLGLEEISVYDVMGRVVWHGKPQRNQIDLSNLENGLYTLRTTSGNAAKVVVQR